MGGVFGGEVAFGGGKYDAALTFFFRQLAGDVVADAHGAVFDVLRVNRQLERDRGAFAVRQAGGYGGADGFAQLGIKQAAVDGAQHLGGRDDFFILVHDGLHMRGLGGGFAGLLD